MHLIEGMIKRYSFNNIVSTRIIKEQKYSQIIVRLSEKKVMNKGKEIVYCPAIASEE